MAGGGNGFGGSYRHGVEHDVFHSRGHLEPMRPPTRIANVLIAAGLSMVAVAIMFLPALRFSNRFTSLDLSYSDLPWDELGGVAGIVHGSPTSWIGLGLALLCLGLCARRISDDAATLVSTVCGLVGAGYLAFAALLVRAEFVSEWPEWAIAPADQSIEAGLGVWVALAGAVVCGLGCLVGYRARTRDEAAITTSLAPPLP